MIMKKTALMLALASILGTAHASGWGFNNFSWSPNFNWGNGPGNGFNWSNGPSNGFNWGNGPMGWNMGPNFNWGNNPWNMGPAWQYGPPLWMQNGPGYAYSYRFVPPQDSNWQTFSVWNYTPAPMQPPMPMGRPQPMPSAPPMPPSLPNTTPPSSVK
jgi:hypothetical protein